MMAHDHGAQGRDSLHVRSSRRAMARSKYAYMAIRAFSVNLSYNW
jgi:hypothetical protein